MERLALVTGAASGIGRAITERLVADGMRVLAADIDLAGLDAVRTAFGDSVVTSQCDVTSEESVAETCEYASSLGGLDVVVANAGRGAFSAIIDHPLSEWQAILDLCLTGVFLTVKHSAPVTHDGGSIITIASLNATQPSSGMSAYCAAKAGVVMLSKVAAMELGARGIRVNTIAPGLVETAATGAFFMVPGVVEEFVDNTTVGRFAQPSDVANMASFLAGPESTFVSGSLFPVDGGASTKRYPDLPAAFARLASPAE
ncbi:MAG: SDR family oxidoreductase [Actinobacteria bacterium]|nr:SDR family oxidoreductase [Actinomycetota bacterium]